MNCQEAPGQPKPACAECGIEFSRYQTSTCFYMDEPYLCQQEIYYLNIQCSNCTEYYCEECFNSLDNKPWYLYKKKYLQWGKSLDSWCSSCITKHLYEREKKKFRVHIDEMDSDEIPSKKIKDFY